MKISTYKLLTFLSCLTLTHCCLYGQQLNWKELKETDGLPSNYIYDIVEDSIGHLWLGTKNGISLFDGFRTKSFPDQTDSVSSYPIFSIYPMPNGKFWLGTQQGLKIFNPLTKQFESSHLQFSGPNEDFIHLSNGQVLASNAKAIYRIKDFDSSHATMDTFDLSYYKNLSNVPVIANEFFEDSQGFVYIAIFGFGTIKGKASDLGNWDKFQRIQPAKNGDFSRCLSVKRYADGSIIFNYIGEGLYFYNALNNQFQPIEGYAQNGPDYERVQTLTIVGKRLITSKIIKGLSWKSLDQPSATPKAIPINNLPNFNLIEHHITKIHISSSVIFLATLGDGLKYAKLDNPGLQTYTLADKLDPLTPIYTLGYHQNHIWAGTSGKGIIRINLDQNQNLDKAEYWSALYGNHINTDSIAEIHFSTKDELWIATAQGLHYFDANTVAKLHTANNDVIPKVYQKTDDLGSLSSNVVNDIFEYEDGSIFLATQSGLNRFNPTSDNFTNHQNSLEPLYSKSSPIFYADYLAPSIFLTSSDKVQDIIDGELVSSYREIFSKKNVTILHTTRENKNTVWLGTNAGLFKFDIPSRKIVPFKNSSFFDVKINSIIYSDNKLWMGSSKGILMYDLENGNYKQYDVPLEKGWPFFHYGSICHDSLGNIYFGTNRGVVQIKPKVLESQYLPIDKQYITINHIRNLTENQVVPFSLGDKLHFNQHDLIEIEVSIPIHYLTDHAQLEYSLNEDGDWIPLDRQDPKIFIHQLSAGTYQFSIRRKAYANTQLQSITIPIEIQKPVWLRWWAITLYAFMSLVLIFIYISYALKQADLRQHLKIERLERLNQQMIANSKFEFVSHISHEFRTPLTLILNDIDSLRAKRSSNSQVIIETIEKNTIRLKNLVNELMDLKKLEKGALQLSVSQHDLISFVRDNVLLFDEIASKYHISLSFDTELIELPLWFNMGQMEKVLYNLVSNALKFTDPNGAIQVSVSTYQRDTQTTCACIKVRDTGCGIASNHLDQIFDNEFQTLPKDSKNFQSSGIGLFVTKKLVELHQGIISVSSETGKGTEFIIELLLGNDHFETHQLLVDSSSLSKSNYTKDSIDKAIHNSKPSHTVLVVEDDTSLREMLQAKLSATYKLLVAKDGLEGIEIAKRSVPDLIITDLAMPKKNGFSLIRELKQYETTHDIPIIVLTAFTEEDKQIKSLNLGVNGYLHKPFNSRLLLSMSHNLIQAREAVQTALKDIAGTDIIYQLPDSDLIKSAIKIVQANLSNPDFSVDDLAQRMKLSRSHLYTKFSELTDYSPKEFIHIMRVRQGAKFLKKGEFKINEIAMIVGYFTVKSFRKHFKAYYGISPSEYLKNQ